jgi:hypothetical protein
MAMSSCSVCAIAGVGATSELDNTAWARSIGVSESSVRRHYQHPARVETATEEPVSEKLTGRVNITPDGGEFVDVQTAEEISDWSGIFKRFKLDPEAFIIVGNTVRMSMWQSSKRTDNGDRDVIDLFSYRASFKRKETAGIDLSSLTASVRAWTPTYTLDPQPAGDALTYVVGLADWQLGKGENDGTPGTLKRLQASLAAIIEHIEELRATGVNINHIAFANMGDHTEGVSGSYASQTYQADLNTRDQLALAIDVNMQWIKALTPMFEHASYIACLCNHGTLARQGHDNITDDADNATGFVGDMLEKICNLHPDLSHIQWHVPRDEMITTITASGVNIAAAHGHKISGREDHWLAAQSQLLTQSKKFIPDLWFTAHKHHAAVTDFGPYTRIQATTVDPGSKWWTDISGMYSRPGVTTFVVGESLPGKWSHYRIH